MKDFIGANKGIGNKDTVHDGCHDAAMRRDEEHVTALVAHSKTCMTNPFDVHTYPDNLINISTGLHGSFEVQSLPKLLDKGQHMLEQFLENCLSEGSSRSFYAPLSKFGIKTFADMHGKSKMLSKGISQKSIISPEMVFQRALTLAEVRTDVTAESVLSHPVGTVPSSLFHDDGTMRKTKKSDLADVLKGLTSPCSTLPPFN